MKFKKPDPDLNCPCTPEKVCEFHKPKFYGKRDE